ncbi:NAD(P)-binding protein [Hypoxylon crocopeplum]|nr:NAD(P)-binding protein [Hypoxylon crocopeplum]
MSDKAALVTGATGLLGRQVVRAFERSNWNIKGTGYSRADGLSVLKVDLVNAEQVAAALDNVKYVFSNLIVLNLATSSRNLPTDNTLSILRPRVVVHCAANRFPDKCDKDPEGTRALNVEASRRLASLCASRNILLIYISTDYVFPGRPGDAPYEADAKPQPTNMYGQTKLDGEQVVIEEYQRAGKPGLGLVLRVPVLYGDAEVPAESAVNILMDTVWKAQEGPKIKMDHWALRYPTNDISVKYLDSEDPSKLPYILQFSSEDKYTKYEICEAFGEIMGLSIAAIEPNTEGNDPNAAVQRPYDCHLSTKALKDLGIDVSTQDFTGWWRWQVKAFRK